MSFGCYSNLDTPCFLIVQNGTSEPLFSSVGERFVKEYIEERELISMPAGYEFKEFEAVQHMGMHAFDPDPSRLAGGYALGMCS
jgi:hypothetical protein